MDRGMEVADRTRAARLFDDHADAVHAYVARRLGSDLAADVLADVYEAAITQLDRFDAARGTERAWLLGIATNRIRRHWRTARRRLLAWQRAGRSHFVAGDPLLDVDRRLDAIDETARVMRAVADLPAEDRDLPAEDRDLLALWAWEGLPYAACAEVLEQEGTAVEWIDRHGPIDGPDGTIDLPGSCPPPSLVIADR